MHTCTILLTYFDVVPLIAWSIGLHPLPSLVTNRLLFVDKINSLAILLQIKNNIHKINNYNYNYNIIGNFYCVKYIVD